MKGRKVQTSSVRGTRRRHEIAMLGHELGNVLHGLSGMVALLRESGLPAEQDRWLDAIEQSGRQLRSLIDSFQSLKSEPGAGIEPRISRFDGLNLLEHIVISHTPGARAGGNRLVLIVDPALPGNWRCDPCMLRQLLDNLLGNAIKYTQSGEVVLEARLAPQKSGAGDGLLLTVSDTGPGITARDGNRIFQAYQRVRDGNGCVDGAGLGLYICRSIVQALQGKLEWSNPAGGGSRFSVLLAGVPVHRAESLAPRDSSLFSQIRCQIRLRKPMGSCVENILTRLGVEWAGQEADEAKSANEQLTVRIGEAGSTRAGYSPALELSPLRQSGDGLPVRLLYPPVLESTLGPLLMEMTLEWLSSRKG